MLPLYKKEGKKNVYLYSQIHVLSITRRTDKKLIVSIAFRQGSSAALGKGGRLATA